MKIQKQDLYEKAKKAYQMYLESKDDEYGIESAVYAGLYYGCGGKKRIKVISHYLILTMVTLIVAKVKEKSGNSLYKNIGLLGEVMEEHTGGDLIISAINTTGKYSLLNISRVNNNSSFTVNIDGNKFTDKIFSFIAENIMKTYSYSGIETLEKQKLYRSHLLRGLRLIG